MRNTTTIGELGEERPRIQRRDAGVVPLRDRAGEDLSHDAAVEAKRCDLLAGPAREVVHETGRARDIGQVLVGVAAGRVYCAWFVE